MASQPKFRFSAEEYLTLERTAEYRSEFVDGEIFAMAGTTIPHNELIMNLYQILKPRRQPGCDIYVIDVRLNIPSANVFTYPDLMVVCGKRPADSTDQPLNPTLIAEVLSPATEGYDRGRKFDFYKRLDNLQHYLLISQDRISVDLFTRQASGDWLLHSATNLSDTVEPLGIPLAELYEGIELP